MAGKDQGSIVSAFAFDEDGSSASGEEPQPQSKRVRSLSRAPLEDWLSKRTTGGTFLDRAKRAKAREKRQPGKEVGDASFVEAMPQEFVNEDKSSKASSSRSKPGIRNKMSQAPGDGEATRVQRERIAKLQTRSQSVMTESLEIRWEDTLKIYVEKTQFVVVIVMLVIAHTLFLAFDTDYDLDQWPGVGPRSVSFAVDLFFTLMYILEACIRVAAHRKEYVKDGWNILDCVLITLAIIDLATVAVNSSSDASLNLAPGFRLLRLLRLARLMRLLRFFKPLWLLACGVVASMRTVLWAWVLVGILIYIFALFFTSTFELHACKENADPELAEYFGSFPRSLLSTFQMTTLEDWANLAEVAVRNEWWIGPFILLLLMLSTWGIMQSIIAVFVNSALEASSVRSRDLAKKMKEEHEEACRQLSEVFWLADSDGNGSLSKAEFEQVMMQPNIIKRLNAVGIDAQSARELFDILDVDGSQSLDGSEFVEGVLRSRGVCPNRDLLALRCDVWRVNLSIEEDLTQACQYIQRRVLHTVSKIQALQEEYTTLLQRVESAPRRFSAL